MASDEEVGVVFEVAVGAVFALGSAKVGVAPLGTGVQRERERMREAFCM